MNTMRTTSRMIPCDQWFCETCNSRSMSFKEMEAHLSSVHGMNYPMTTRKDLLMRMLGLGWETIQYSWVIVGGGNEVKLLNNVTKRLKEVSCE
jgi:hypothetical protein